MKPVLLLLAALPAFAQEQDVQRALMQRDQQSAAFAARLRAAPLGEQQRLENLSAQQLLDVARDLPQELRPYERQKAAREHILALPPFVVRTAEAEKPQPLPAKMPGVVDVVPAGASDSRSGALQNLTQDRSLR